MSKRDTEDNLHWALARIEGLEWAARLVGARAMEEWKQGHDDKANVLRLLYHEIEGEAKKTEADANTHRLALGIKP